MTVSARPLLLLSLTACLVATGLTAGATAAPRSCHLITDARGDATGRPPVTMANDPALDVVSADVASNRTWITAVVRVAAVQPPPRPAEEQLWQVSFTIGSTHYYLRAQTVRGELVGWVGTMDAEGFQVGVPEKARAVSDPRKHEIRITAPIAGFTLDAALRPGQVLRQLTAETYQVRQAANVTLLKGIDGAKTSRTYAAGTPSCVVVGR